MIANNKVTIEKILLNMSMVFFVACILAYEIITIILKNPSVRNIFLLIGFLLLFVWFILFATQNKIRFYRSELAWFLIVFVMFFGNQNLIRGSYISFFSGLICIFSMLLLVNSDDWFHVFIKLIKILSLIHAIATITFWVFPNLYNMYLPIISSLTPSSAFMGYKSALSIHYSTNGMYLAVGLLAHSTFLCDIKKKKRDLILFVVVLFAIFLTTKRAHLLFSVASIIGAQYFSRKEAAINRVFKILFILLLCLILFIFALQFFPVLMDSINRFIVESGDDITSGRHLLYELAIDSIKENFVFGIGWGGYPYLWRESILPSIFKGRTGMDTHNVYLQLLCEVGVVGFIIVMAILLYALYLCISFYSKQRKGLLLIPAKYDKPLLFSLSMQLFFFCYCITGNPLYDMNIYLIYFFCCGITYSVRRRLVLNYI